MKEENDKLSMLLYQFLTVEYICWLDAHCVVAPGFDEVLVKDCQDDWVIVPSMYSMDLEKWDRVGEPEDYRYWTWSSLKSGKRLRQWTWKKKK